MQQTPLRSRPGLPPLGGRVWLGLLVLNAALVIGMLTIWHEARYGLAIWLLWVALTLYTVVMAVWQSVRWLRTRRPA